MVLVFLLEFILFIEYSISILLLFSILEGTSLVIPHSVSKWKWKPPERTLLRAETHSINYKFLRNKLPPLTILCSSLLLLVYTLRLLDISLMLLVWRTGSAISYLSFTLWTHLFLFIHSFGWFGSYLSWNWQPPVRIDALTLCITGWAHMTLWKNRKERC